MCPIWSLYIYIYIHIYSHEDSMVYLTYSQPVINSEVGYPIPQEVINICADRCSVPVSIIWRVLVECVGYAGMVGCVHVDTIGSY